MVCIAGVHFTATCVHMENPAHSNNRQLLVYRIALVYDFTNTKKKKKTKIQTTPKHFINTFCPSNRGFLPPNRNCFGFNAANEGYSKT